MAYDVRAPCAPQGRVFPKKFNFGYEKGVVGVVLQSTRDMSTLGLLNLFTPPTFTELYSPIDPSTELESGRIFSFFIIT